MVLLHLASCLLLVAARHERQEDVDAIEIAVSGDEACASFSDDSIRCTDGLADERTEPGLHRLSGGADGIGGFCAIDADDSLVCWDSYETPPNGRFRDVAPGGPCALSMDGDIVCWGIADPDSTPSDADFTALAATIDKGCAVRPDERASCWASVDLGLAQVPRDPLTAVALTSNTACGLTEDHDVECWGYDAPEVNTAFQTVAASSGTFGGVTTDGAVRFWGENAGTMATNVPGGTWRALAFDDEVACGIRDDGTVACWGDRPPDGADMVPISE